MIIFNYKGNCPICNKEITFKSMSTLKYNKEYLCYECVKKLSNNGGHSILKNLDKHDIDYLLYMVSDEIHNHNLKTKLEKIDSFRTISAQWSMSNMSMRNNKQSFKQFIC